MITGCASGSRGLLWVVGLLLFGWNQSKLKMQMTNTVSNFEYRRPDLCTNLHELLNMLIHVVIAIQSNLNLTWPSSHSISL
jgi:hypothetical protein